MCTGNFGCLDRNSSGLTASSSTFPGWGAPGTPQGVSKLCWIMWKGVVGLRASGSIAGEWMDQNFTKGQSRVQVGHASSRGEDRTSTRRTPELRLKKV